MNLEIMDLGWDLGLGISRYVYHITKGMINRYVTNLNKCDVYPLKKPLLNNVFEGKV